MALTITASTAVRGEGGDWQKAWGGTEARVRGMWRKVSFTEGISNGGSMSRASGVWEIPWVPAVSEEFRVTYIDRNGTTHYQRIIGIDDPDKQSKELHLYVVEDEGAQ